MSSTDYFTPCVGDPYLQGQIAFCNVVSDIYVMGFEAIDNVLMILCVSTQMSKADKHRVTSQMIRGFLDKAEEAGTKITGGHSVVNPWVMIGGVAMAVVKGEEMVRNSARVGDVLLLTKPLGTQPATNVKEWLVNDKREKDDGFWAGISAGRGDLPEEMKERLQKAGKLWVICQQYISEEEADAAYAKAARFMSTLNKYAASLMKKYEAHGATDITGFGVLGHAQNLAEAQQHGEMDFEITSLPIIKGMDLIDKKVVNYGLLEGKGVETSGGLLIALPKDKAAGFQKEFREKFEMESWIVGRVRERKGGKNMAYLAEKTEIVIVWLVWEEAGLDLGKF